MSYKQFIQELEDDILPSEAERRYGYNCKIVFVLKAAGVMSCFFCLLQISRIQVRVYHNTEACLF